jgi:HK97 family phage major capsid protein
MMNDITEESNDESQELSQADSSEKTQENVKSIVVVNNGEEKMSENNVVEASMGDEHLKKINDSIAHIMSILEDTKAAKAGYITDGGIKDATIKSFGDFLIAVRRQDHERLTKVYKTTKDLGESPGSAGGYVVPTEYGQNLIQVAAMENQVYSRVQRVPVMRESGTYPALDQYFAPTAGSGNTAFAGGVSAAFTQPGTTFTETQPAFSVLNWRLNKTGGFTEVENELIEDSPFAIEALLRGLFQVAISAKNERNILRGSGVGEPLGILNSNAAVGVSDNTTDKFKWEDVGSMYARYKGIGGTPVWIIHPSVWPQIMTMNNSTVTAWQSNLAGSPQNVLNGYPVITSEHMPQLGTTGAVLLADLSAYVMFEKPGLTIGYSEHVGFTRDVGTWIFKQRNDGKSWLQSAITLAGPGSAYTVSPFVYLIRD